MYIFKKDGLNFCARSTDFLCTCKVCANEAEILYNRMNMHNELNLSVKANGDLVMIYAFQLILFMSCKKLI